MEKHWDLSSTDEIKRTIKVYDVVNQEWVELNVSFIPSVITNALNQVNRKRREVARLLKKKDLTDEDNESLSNLIDEIGDDSLNLAVKVIDLEQNNNGPFEPDTKTWILNNLGTEQANKLVLTAPDIYADVEVDETKKPPKKNSTMSD